MDTKICSICKIEKTLDQFYYEKSKGKYRPECKTCNYQRVKKWRQSNKDKIHNQYLRYYEKNQELVKTRNKKWSNANKDKIKEIAHKYYLKNRNYILEKQKEYKKLNPNQYKNWWAKNKQRLCNVFKERYYTDPKFHINHTISNRIRSSLKSGKNGHRWESLVGYTLTELMEHLESKFQPGMTWDNYGEWHIDHIIPISYFDYSSYDDETFKICWDLNNLQPLWAKDNLIKSNKLINENIEHFLDLLLTEDYDIV